MDNDQIIMRISQIRYELTKPVQSQFIKGDCEFLLQEYDRLLEAYDALSKQLAECDAALTLVEGIAATERENSYAMAKAISECLGILERTE